MSTTNGVNVAMLLEEPPEFWEFLATTGDIWACAMGDNSKNFQYEPQPVAKFLKRHAKKLRRYDMVDVLIGHREHLLKPCTESHWDYVGGKLESVVRDGKIVPGEMQMAGGEHVWRTYIHYQASLVMRYMYENPDKSGVRNRTNVYYHFGHFEGDQWVKKPEELLKWAKRVLAWLRKRITDEVPVYRCKYSISATARMAAAVREGL